MIPLKRKEIYVALFHTSAAAPEPVGLISYSDRLNPPKNGRATFSYLSTYQGPPLDPINLNYKRDGIRTYVLPDSLESSGLFRVFTDSMPGTWGRMKIKQQFPETAQFNDMLLLAWLSERGFASGALLFFSKKPDDESPLRRIKSVDDVRVKSMRDLAGLVADLNQNELKASIVHGGARAKTTYFDETGEVGPPKTHYLVKFNVVSDPFNSARVEASTLALAAKAGINAVGTIVVKVTAQGRHFADIFLTRRYDRFTDSAGHDVRKHRISLLSLCGAVKDQSHGDYKEVVAMIRSVSSNPEADTAEMFRRILFNIAVNNTDDHLKNHEMVYSIADGWRLSPAYDVVPNSYSYAHATAIAGFSHGAVTDDFVLRIGAALKVPPAQALKIRDDVVAAVSQWPGVFEQNGCSEADCKYMLASVQQSGVRAAELLGFGSGKLDPLVAAKRPLSARSA